MSNLSKDDIGKIAVTLFLLLTAVGVGYNSCLGPGSVHKYLGKWQRAEGNDIINIQRLSSNKTQPLKTINIGEEASLLLPVAVLPYPQIGWGTVGGIYRMGHKDVLILWCNIDQTNIVMGLRKGVGVIEIGIPDKDRNSFYNQLQPDHTQRRHREYTPKKWITYRQVDR